MDDELVYGVIEVPDLNDSMSSVVLCGTEYQIRFTYIDTFDYWTFGLYDAQGEPIRQGIKIVPGAILNLFLGTDKAPSGIFMAVTGLEHIGRNDFKNGKAQFAFKAL